VRTGTDLLMFMIGGTRAVGSASKRKAIEGGYVLQSRVHLPQIDLLAQERDLVLQCAFFQVHVPGPRISATALLNERDLKTRRLASNASFGTFPLLLDAIS
jgi:hypothetical protein